MVRDGKTVVLHPEVGKPGKGWVAVAGTDLKEGEPVIVEGGYNLPEGTAVLTGKRRESTRTSSKRQGRARSTKTRRRARTT